MSDCRLEEKPSQTSQRSRNAWALVPCTGGECVLGYTEPSDLLVSSMPQFSNTIFSRCLVGCTLRIRDGKTYLSARVSFLEPFRNVARRVDVHSRRRSRWSDCSQEGRAFLRPFDSFTCNDPRSTRLRAAVLGYEVAYTTAARRSEDSCAGDLGKERNHTTGAVAVLRTSGSNWKRTRTVGKGQVDFFDQQSHRSLQIRGKMLLEPEKSLRAERACECRADRKQTPTGMSGVVQTQKKMHDARSQSLWAKEAVEYSFHHCGHMGS